MLKKFITVAAIGFCSLVFVSSAWAQASNTATGYKKNTIIKFDGAVIEGELIRPTGEIIQVSPPTIFVPMVQARANFWSELKASGCDI